MKKKILYLLCVVTILFIKVVNTQIVNADIVYEPSIDEIITKPIILLLVAVVAVIIMISFYLLKKIKKGSLRKDDNKNSD